jgi:hydrogenase nickel incorporation protein HypB
VCTTCGCGISLAHDDHGHAHTHDHRHGHDHQHDHNHAHEHDDRAARTLRLERDLLAKNTQLAAENRRAAALAGLAIFNLIGSPGAGKTALLESLVRRLRHHRPVAVLEGDQATDRDARRIESAGCPVLQINTGTGCHLDATMIERGLMTLAPRRGSVVFIENVGNLVCPALFDLGERAKLVVMSVTEGEDKPLKYPHVFRAAKAFVLTKTDLAPHVDFDEERCIRHAREVAGSTLEILRTSAKSGAGLEELVAWVQRHSEERP